MRPLQTALSPSHSAGAPLAPPTHQGLSGPSHSPGPPLAPPTHQTPSGPSTTAWSTSQDCKEDKTSLQELLRSLLQSLVVQTCWTKSMPGVVCNLYIFFLVTCLRLRVSHKQTTKEIKRQGETERPNICWRVIGQAGGLIQTPCFIQLRSCEVKGAKAWSNTQQTVVCGICV